MKGCQAKTTQKWRFPSLPRIEFGSDWQPCTSVLCTFLHLQASVWEAYKTIIYKIILGFTWSSAWCGPTTEYADITSPLRARTWPLASPDSWSRLTTTCCWTSRGWPGPWGRWTPRIASFVLQSWGTSRSASSLVVLKHLLMEYLYLSIIRNLEIVDN